MNRQITVLQKIVIFVLSILLTFTAVSALIPATSFAWTVDDKGNDVLQRTDIVLSTYSYAYDGKEKKPTVSVLDSEGNELLSGITEDVTDRVVGDYKITVKFPRDRKDPGEKPITVTIKKVDDPEWVVTAERSYFIYSLGAYFITHPTARDLTYDGTEQVLINPGRHTMGVAVYSLEENGEYTTNLPTATNAGKYTVWYYLRGEGYEENSPKYSLTVEIKGSGAPSTDPLANVKLESKTVVYDGKSHSLTLSGALPTGYTATFSKSDISEIGVHEITVTIKNGNETVKTLTATLTINRPTLSFDIDKNNEDDVILSSANGFAPNLQLEVSVVPKESYSKYNLEKRENVETAFAIKLISNGSTVQPEGSVTLKLLIPEDLRGHKFKILQVDGSNATSVSYTIDGNYAVITTSKVNESVFIYEQVSLLWVIFLLIGIILVEIIILVMAIVKQKQKRKEKSAGATTYSIAPLILASFIAGSELTFVIALSVAVVGLVVGNVYVRRRNAKEDSDEDKPTDAKAKSQVVKNNPAPVKQPVENKPVENVSDNKVVEDNSPADAVSEDNEVAEESVADDVVAENSEPSHEEEKSDAYNALFVGVAAEKEEQPEEVAVIPEVVSEEQEVLMGIEEGTGLAIVARYKKSFMAKLIQSPDETKRYYSVLKNALLSYKKTSSRVSWNYDSINSGRLKLAKFTIRGKTLNLYLNLEADDYADTKYKVFKSTSKRFAEVSLRYKIKNERRLKYALELIKDLADKHGLVLGEEANENYIYPFETTEALIEKGLIKEILTKETYSEYLEKRNAWLQANPQNETTTIPEIVNEDEEVFVGIEEETGLEIVARYKKSFTAKLIQAPDETKKYYSELKNAILSYKKTASRVSWNYDSINVGRLKLAKFTIRGKTLTLYLNLEADDYANTKYKVFKSTSKRFAGVSLRYRITSERRLKYAFDLVKDLAEKHGLVLGEKASENYVCPFENTEALMEKGLIKEVLIKRRVENK